LAGKGVGSKTQEEIKRRLLPEEFLIDVWTDYEDGSAVESYVAAVSVNGKTGKRRASLALLPVAELADAPEQVAVVTWSCSANSEMPIATFKRLCKTILEGTTTQHSQLEAGQCSNAEDAAMLDDTQEPRRHGRPQ
jgi:hypothetical protein